MSTENALEGAQSFWQGYMNKKVSLEEARVITENLTGFFETLARWSAQSEVAARTIPDGCRAVRAQETSVVEGTEWVVGTSQINKGKIELCADGRGNRPLVKGNAPGLVSPRPDGKTRADYGNTLPHRLPNGQRDSV